MYARNFKFQVSVHFRGGAALILLQSFSKKKKVKAEVKLYATLEGKKKKRQENSRKTSSSVSFKAFGHNKLWKILKEMGIPTALSAP